MMDVALTLLVMCGVPFYMRWVVVYFNRRRHVRRINQLLGRFR